MNTSKVGGGYPLCTLTYVEAFHGYHEGRLPRSRRGTVNDDVNEYLVQEAGQETIESRETYYAPLPTSPELAHDVLGAAQFAAGKISF